MTGRVTSFVCRPRATCETKWCAGHATHLCDYPVKRDGRRASCSRHVCGKCVQRLGGRDYCPPHARLKAAELKVAAEKRADDEKLRRILSEFRPCSEVAQDEAEP